MTYGMFEMQMEDEQAHEDRMAITSGTMCRFCLSVVHVADSYETCPRIQQEEAEAAKRGSRYMFDDAEIDAYWKEQESKPDFTCTDCGANAYYPHEGKYLDIHNEDACRCIDCHLKNFVPCDSERCCT